MGNTCLHSRISVYESDIRKDASITRKSFNPQNLKQPSRKRLALCLSKSKPFYSFLSNSWPGSILDWNDEDLASFTSCFTPFVVKDGHEISTSDPSSFYIIVEGNVEVHAVLPTICRKTNNLREFLCRKGVGDMLYMAAVKKLVEQSNAKDLYEKENHFEGGEHSEHKNILRMIDTLTIKSSSNSTLLQLNWKMFEEKFGGGRHSNPSLDVDMLRTLMRTNLADYIAAIPVFKDVPQLKLELIARLCHYSIEKQGATICKEGEDGDEVYIVLGGKVKVEVAVSKRMVELFQEGILTRAEDGTLSQGREALITRRTTLLQAAKSASLESLMVDKSINKSEKPSVRTDIADPIHTVELATLGKGECFGEISSFIDVPRAATVTAKTNVLMVSISKTNFRAIYHKVSPHLKFDVEVIVKRHMLQTLLQSKSPFLEVVNADQAKRMADLASLTTIEKDTVVFRQGDTAENFYFVYSGRLRVEKKGKQEVNFVVHFLHSGDYFGELALLNDTGRRVATIVAQTKAVLLEITQDDFQECFKETPQLMAEFIVRTKGTNVDLESLLNYEKAREAFEEYLNACGKLKMLRCCDDLEAYEKAIHQEKNLVVKDTFDRANILVQKYFTKNAPDFVELPQSEEQKVAQKLMFLESAVNNATNMTELNGSIFKTTIEAVRQQLDLKLLPAFKESETFQILTSRLRAYNGDEQQLMA